jgi:hypothetical protein
MQCFSLAPDAADAFREIEVAVYKSFSYGDKLAMRLVQLVRFGVLENPLVKQECNQ